MKRAVKRGLVAAAAVVVLLGIVAAVIWRSAFGNNRPIVDGPLVPGVEIVKDSFVSVAMLDVGRGKVALIDAGNDAGAKAILAALARRKLDASAVVAILLTHGHGDHTAGCRAFPGAQVYAMENEIALVGGACTVSHPLHDGEKVTLDDLSIEALATPGHTPGSVVYFARGVLFFGDSARGAKDGTMMPAVRAFSKDPAQNAASLDALAARMAPRAAEVTTLDFAHSGPLQGFAPLADFARK